MSPIFNARRVRMKMAARNGPLEPFIPLLITAAVVPNRAYRVNTVKTIFLKVNTILFLSSKGKWSLSVHPCLLLSLSFKIARFLNGMVLFDTNDGFSYTPPFYKPVLMGKCYAT
jgi:hypothetical protein